MTNNFQISNWVHSEFVVSDIRIVKSSHDVENSVSSLDVRQEGVSETFSLGGSSHETGNVDHLQDGLDFRFGLKEVAEKLESFVRDRDSGFVGVDSAEREVFGRGIQFW